jgi:predicted ATPase
MRFTNISVRNYKSLRSINIQPGELTVIVGANASGKSNLTDCLDFISEVYRHGLEVAIGRKGGFDSIAFRKVRRTKLPIEIHLDVEVQPDDLRPFFFPTKDQAVPEFRIAHTFSFAARGASIKAEYVVTYEKVVIQVRRQEDWHQVAVITRSDNEFELEIDPEISKRANRRVPRDFLDFLLDFPDLEFFKKRTQPVPSTELIVNFIGRFVHVLYSFSQTVGGMRAFQISPTKSREFGVPTPRPELDRYGENLPAVIDTMQKRNKSAWKSVLQSMRAILPDLKRIDVDYTHTRRLGLFFKEEGFGRSWSVEEVSDGTVQTLALLVAIFDPDSTALVIEEPENSVHPWIIRNIIDACREASKEKQIMITTHSPIVMNAVKPEEMWVIWRSQGESRIVPVNSLDEDFYSMWKDGHISTFEYLDSGALPNALPPAPSEDLELVDA